MHLRRTNAFGRCVVLMLSLLVCGCDDEPVTGNSESSAAANGSAAQTHSRTPFPPSGILQATLVSQAPSNWRYRLRFDGDAESFHVSAQLRERGQIVHRDEGGRRLFRPETLGVIHIAWDGCGLNLYIDAHDDDRGRLDTLVGLDIGSAQEGRQVKVYSAHSVDLDGLLAPVKQQLAEELADKGVGQEQATHIGKQVETESRRQLGRNLGATVSTDALIPFVEVNEKATASEICLETVEAPLAEAGKGIMLGAVLYNEAEEDKTRSLKERVARAPRALVLLVRLSGKREAKTAEDETKTARDRSAGNGE